jgi:hypothetical protein
MRSASAHGWLQGGSAGGNSRGSKRRSPAGARALELEHVQGELEALQERSREEVCMKRGVYLAVLTPCAAGSRLHR